MNKAKKRSNYCEIKSKTKYIIFLIIYFTLYPFAKLLYGRKKNWLICERGDDAQDNGFIFFKFLVKKHTELNPIYLIKKTAQGYKTISQIGNVVSFGSLKHLLMVIGCPVLISSQLFGYSPWIQMTLYFRRNRTKNIHVFLQHGIIKNTHEGLFGDVCKSLNLFVCGAKPEYDFVFNEFNYQNDVPQYTGLARYDLLADYHANNQIIIMPTWRTYLIGVNDDSFVESEFFKNWSSLLNNESLIQSCKTNNLRVKLYLHYSLQKYSHLFNDNDVVKVVKFGEEAVQDLLKESKLLVTDFSSVYFDFGYMRKPVVYFQFDQSAFNNEHYSKGYFDYKRDGFGDVCLNISETVNTIIKLIDNNFGPEKKYLDRMDTNFVFRDTQNCERIYNRICDIQNKK